jgi:hypothetical protein
MSTERTASFPFDAVSSFDEQPLSGHFTIGSTPSWETFKRREAHLAGTDLLDVPIPAEFPHQVSSPSVWTPTELNLADVTFALDATEIEELETALGIFQSRF